MSKQYSKSELEKKSVEYFSQNKEVKEIFYTTDGQPFLMENRADIHAKTSKLDVFVFKNLNEQSESNDEINIDSSAPVLIGAIQLYSDVEKLKLFLSKENEKAKPRTTVVAALEKRIAELNTDSDDLESEDEGQESSEDKNENQDNPE